MTINYHDFYTLFGAAGAEQNRDRYIAEWSSSSIFYPDDNGSDIDAGEIADILDNIWDIAHLTTRDIRQHLGLTQAAFAERFCISLRTIEGWEAGRREPPKYIILALAELSGMLTVKRA